MPSIEYQIEVAAKLSISTALLALASWIYPIVHARRMRYIKALLISGVGTELMLALRALISSQAIFDWNSRSPFVEQFVSPSTLFGEYNWLTYIFEVGPLVSIAAALLTCVGIWIAKRMPFAVRSN
jgi:hypothetical protein